MGDTLVDKLNAALDETERIAQRAAALNPTWSYDRETFTVASTRYSVAARKADGSPINDVDGEHIAHNDPAAVLRRVAADRKILELHADSQEPAGDDRDAEYLHGYRTALEKVLATLAEAYGIEETSR